MSSELGLDLVAPDLLALGVRHVARDEVAATGVDELGPLPLGESVGVRLEAAPRAERAPLRDVDQAGRGALDRLQPLATIAVQPGHRPEQAPGVGVLGRVEDVLGAAVLRRPTG